MPAFLRILAISVLLLCPAALSAAENPAPGSGPSEGGPSSPFQRDRIEAVEKAVIEALRKAMSLLATTLDAAIPYELPEVLPNGDIIIRRKPPSDAPVPTGKVPEGVIGL